MLIFVKALAVCFIPPENGTASQSDPLKSNYIYDAGISGFLSLFNFIQFCRWAEIYFDHNQLPGAHFEALKTMVSILVMITCQCFAWSTAVRDTPAATTQAYVVFFWS